METKVNFNVMECVETIVKFSEDSQLQEPFFEPRYKEIESLSHYLQVEKAETVLFACAVAFWLDKYDFTRVFQHLGFKEYQILKYRNEIDHLYQKNLLINKDANGLQVNKYDVSQTVLFAVSKNFPLKIYANSEEKSDKNLVDILEELDTKSEDFDLDRIKSYEFRGYVENLREECQAFPVFQFLKDKKLTTFELFFLLDTIWDAICNGDNDFNTNVSSTVRYFHKGKGEAMRVVNAYRQTGDQANILLFEKRQASGLNHLDGIVHAIKNQKIISFQYTKYWEGIPHKKVIEPFALKEFKNRWYLLANERDGKDFFIKTFGLDRISDLDISKSSFKKNQVDIDAMFVNSFGIISTMNEEPIKITLSFEPWQGMFVKSLPIHHSQKTLIDNDKELKIELNMAPTYDFYQELLTHAERILSIEPKSVCNQYLQFLQTALKVLKN